MRRELRQVDVFGREPYRGNPVAVVLDGEGLSTEEMQRFASWTNLAECTFVLHPSTPEADYRLRIFTPTTELPFAGHPTLGSAHAWLTADPAARRCAPVVQECEAGLVTVRQTADGLAFAAPPLRRSGPVEEPTIEHMATLLGIPREAVVDAQWVDNGPGWAAVLLSSAEDVLALRPGPLDRFIGAVGPHPPDHPEALEVRAFLPRDGTASEDPVTGSLNASLAQWLVGTGRVRAPYTVRQGTALGRAGRVHVSADDAGQLWIGGRTVTCISGHAEL